MATMASAFINVTHLRKVIQSGTTKITILQDINLMIKRGESIAIIGASGSGKSTLLNLLAGIDLPSSGDIIIDNQYLNRENDDQRALWRAHNCGIIFQNFQLIPTLNAIENVMLPLELHYIKTHIAKAKARAILKTLGLSARLMHYPAQLSGGEQQRVAIARAFINQPSVIFADEMTANLDHHSGQMIADNVFELNQRLHTTLILVTHDPHLAARCQRRFSLQEGLLIPC
jgi:putative ABC transport system ATP-binding protein